MHTIARIREMIADGMSDEAIRDDLEDEQTAAKDAVRADEDSAGWTRADSDAMNAAWRDTPVCNDAGEWMP